MIQLARRLTGLTVVATASRPESQKWCLDLGAHAVIDHGKPMKEQIEKLKVPPVALVASLTFTEQHYKAIAEFMAPQGKFGLIHDPQEFTMSAFKGKAISVHWKSMFTRSSFQTPDMIAQHHLLNDVADLIDKGVLRSTMDQAFGTINAANLKRAHALLESGKSRGKIVLEGWFADDGVIDMRHMCAQLMRSSGDRLQRHPGKFRRRGFHHGIVRDCVARAFVAMGGDAHDRVLLALLFRKIGRDAALLRFRHTRHQRPVDLARRAMANDPVNAVAAKRVLATSRQPDVSLSSRCTSRGFWPFESRITSSIWSTWRVVPEPPCTASPAACSAPARRRPRRASSPSAQ